jgi:hypothetical protein
MLLNFEIKGIQIATPFIKDDFPDLLGRGPLALFFELELETVVNEHIECLCDFVHHYVFH